MRIYHPNAMKTSHSILTHAAVFVVGASIAVVASRSKSDDAQGLADGGANSRLASGRTFDSSSTAGDVRKASSRAGRVTGERASSSRSSAAPTELMADIVRMGDPLERQSALIDLLQRLGPDEYAAVAEQYRELDHYGDSGGEFELILRSWAKADPLAAIEYAKESRGQTSVVLSAWAVNDPAAAEQWAIAQHEGDGPNRNLAYVIRGIAVHDLAHAGRTQCRITLEHAHDQRDQPRRCGVYRQQRWRRTLERDAWIGVRIVRRVAEQKFVGQ